MNHSLTVRRWGANLFLGAVCLGLGGCGMFGKVGRIVSGQTTVQGVADAGKPASLAQTNAGASIALAAGSVVTVTKFEAIPATKDTPAQPAREVTEIRPAAPTEYHKTESTVKADTGTVDTSIREHQIDAQESRPLLYGSILMAIACGVFFWLKYPSPALMCAAGSLILFLAWKLSDLPSWFYGLAILAGAGAVGLYFGHERAEKNLKPPTTI